jgi:4-hydroxy-tetrahydrodipicolinate reductase
MPGGAAVSAGKLAIHGAGRMGHGVSAEAVSRGWDVLGLVSRHHPGTGVEPAWFPGLEALEGAAGRPDILIDFSLPAGAVAAARWCAARRIPLVTGTTGLDATQDAVLDDAARAIPLLASPNFSPGVNALLVLLAEARCLLPDVERVDLLDVHHVHKKDAPSGTALALARALAPWKVDIESRREGEVVGDHALTLKLPGETLTLAHHAEDRRVFALGAVKAAGWLLRQPPGRYDAQDWIRNGGG